MRIHPDGAGSVGFLRAAVRECYDIRRDDADLKAIVSLSTDRRADYFRGLRSHYRVRKEFMNYIIELGENHAEEGAVLSSLGFKVERHTF